MIPYIGGKSFLARWIISNFPKNYKQMQYVEPFGGGGWVLYKKEESYLEVYNDLNYQLVNLFKIIRDNCAEFSARAEWCLHSREMYNEAKEKLKNDKTLSDIERSIYYAIQKCQSFAGRGGWAYTVKSTRYSSGKWLSFLKKMELINVRLKKVQIECLEFQEVIKKYDSPSTLFYIDPPYMGVEYYYNTSNVNFGYTDHLRLYKNLSHIKGKFCLSYYKHPEILKLYQKFRIIKRNSVKHCVVVRKNTKNITKPKCTEILIMNY